MSKTLALDFGCILRTTSALVALGFFPAVLPVQLLLVGVGNGVLFTNSASEKILQRLCSAGAYVRRNVYPDFGNDPVVYGS